jgi:hypothetical protein
MPRYLCYSKELIVGWALPFTYSKTREFFFSFLWLKQRLLTSTATFQPSFNIKQKVPVTSSESWLVHLRTKIPCQKNFLLPKTSDRMVSASASITHTGLTHQELSERKAIPLYSTIPVSSFPYGC